MKVQKKILFTVLTSQLPLLWIVPGIWAQTASQREDTRFLQEQILRANHQLDLLLQRLESNEAQISELQSQIKALQKAQQSTDARVKQLDSQFKSEKEALLDEISKILAESSTARAASATTPRQASSGNAHSSSQSSQNTLRLSQENGKYYYVVKRGDTLVSIARALNAQGIRIRPKEIALANNITEETKIQVGQKLLIPKN